MLDKVTHKAHPETLALALTLTLTLTLNLSLSLSLTLNLTLTLTLTLTQSELIKYDRRRGGLSATVLGKVASAYYVGHESMAVYHRYYPRS